MVTKAQAGEQYHTVHRGGNVKVESLLTVLPPCEVKDNGHWYCVTHDTHMGGEWEKSEHLESGTHHMAWCCHTHGVEQP